MSLPIPSFPDQDIPIYLWDLACFSVIFVFKKDQTLVFFMRLKIQTQLPRPGSSVG